MGAVVAKVRAMAGGPPKLLVAKPGLDGHSNGAEQIAVAARDAGMEVVYSGIRLTIEQIAASARDEDPDVIGLSILSGSHLELVPALVAHGCATMGVDAPVVVGGIIPEEDRPRLAAAGVVAVYTPKDFDIARIMDEIADLAAVTPAQPQQARRQRRPLSACRRPSDRTGASGVRRRSTTRGPGPTRSS